ncbi:MAG: DUF1538 domain-containing protein [Bauldia sp.]|nr:DUF1538 domain-containing protein [Bauldia sp.]
MLSSLGTTAADALLAVVPLVVLFLLFQRFFLKLSRRAAARIVLGLVIAAVGLFLFLFGVLIAYIPFGRAIGEALTTNASDWLVILFGLLLGLFTAFGEPAVRILADQVEDASAGAIRKSVVIAAICVGVAVFVAIGLARILYGVPLIYVLAPSYGAVIVLLWLSDRDFTAIAVDAGGVASGPLANTFLLAVALGASAGLGDADPVVSGLGLAALIAVAPIVSVMVLGAIVRRKQRQGGQRE